MAHIVEFATNPRYVPFISFRREERDFLWKPNRLRIPYKPGEVPFQAFLESGNKTVPDFVPINGFMAACPEVRALIESFEPGVHQFMPVHIRRPRSEKPIFRLDGRVLEDPYYLFHVITFLDSIWVERSDVILSEGTSLLGMRPGNYNIVLHKEITAGHHAWREGRIASTRLLFSDELIAAIDARGFKKLAPHHVSEE